MLVVALGLVIAFGSHLPERVFATRAGALFNSEWRLALLALVLFIVGFIVGVTLSASAGFVIFGAAAIALIGAAARSSTRQ